MLQFPGEETFVLLKNLQPVYKQPMPKIGLSVTCRVHKPLPYQLHLYITHVNNEKTAVEYKAVLRLQDFKSNIDENTFLDDFYKIGDTLNGIIVSFGDNYGCYISTISSNME